MYVRAHWQQASTNIALRAFAVCCTAALYKELTTWADNRQVEIWNNNKSVPKI